ncbi:putative asparagine-rich protein [Cardiosporidium cionae]|uniref:Asparagine-rich protein n=1 Tax=Cardiosporidium cionae TaxID=476202 RepID=A0ABQ7J8H2_9APIC|nr:putative asparagine-rich protein [Cardiosporidium cionae]|eukprot:KAF8820264.1 putative asparagine-rich protein [Cardiosporidium cionae]
MAEFDPNFSALDQDSVLDIYTVFSILNCHFEKERLARVKNSMQLEIHENCNKTSDECTMMVYVSWVPKDARCRYMKTLPKNELQREKIPAYLHAKMKMFEVLNRLGFVDIDTILFHPPRGSHIKIKFSSLDCIDAFLRRYQMTPERWKDDMFQEFNIPSKSAESVRDLRIERAMYKKRPIDKIAQFPI